jgi:uncharacterized protein
VYLDSAVRTLVKVLVVGHFGVGKTSYIGSISEIAPLRTEEVMTEASAGVDDLSGTPDKTTTTVAMDFGRLTLNDELVLYMFGTPGQERFKELWEDLSLGALGALVLVDPQRVGESFPVLDLVERYGLPYAIGVNHFEGTRPYPLDEVREALNLPAETPVVPCDVRDQKSAVQALITLVTYLQSRLG